MYILSKRVSEVMCASYNGAFTESVVVARVFFFRMGMREFYTWAYFVLFIIYCTIYGIAFSFLLSLVSRLESAE